MNYSTENVNIALPISSRDHRCASEFAEQQLTPEKKEQIYLNTLAVLITHHYLDMLGIPSEPKSSYSWNPVTQFTANIADLYIPEAGGRVECRVVQEGEQFCFVPEETWDDRIGYVAVKLDKERTEGTVLGFVPQVSAERLPLSRLRSLDDLIDRIDEESKKPMSIGIPKLREWLQGIFDSLDSEKWRPLSELPKGRPAFAGDAASDDDAQGRKLQPYIKQLYITRPGRDPSESSTLPDEDPKEALAHIIQTSQHEETRFKAAELLWELDPYHPLGRACRTTDLGVLLAGHPVALMVAILPRQENGVSIFLRVYPLGKQITLPLGLVLTVLSEEGEIFFEVRARPQDDYVQFKFTADLDDRFSVKVSVGEACITETFIV